MYFIAMQIRTFFIFIFIQKTNKELFLLTHKTIDIKPISLG